MARAAVSSANIANVNSGKNRVVFVVRNTEESNYTTANNNENMKSIANKNSDLAHLPSYEQLRSMGNQRGSADLANCPVVKSSDQKQTVFHVGSLQTADSNNNVTPVPIQINNTGN